jgi:ubiquinone biosynthesis protein
MKEKYSPQNIFTDVTDQFGQINSFLTAFPKDIKTLLSKAQRGKLHFEVELQGYGYLLKKMDSVANRVSLTFLTVAFVIASAISMTATFGPDMKYIYGLPQISVYGLWTAGFFLLLLFISVMRRRKYK